MDCCEFGKMLDQYEELTDLQKQELEDHASECEKCKEELTFYKSLILTLNDLPKMEAPKSLLTDINAKIDEELAAKKRQRSFAHHMRKYAYRYSAVAACIVLVAVVGVNSRDMVERMLNHDDGVISETTNGAIPNIPTNPTAAPVPSADAQPTPQPTAKASAEPVPTASVSKPTVTQKPKAVKTDSPSERVINIPVATLSPTYAPVAKPVVTAAPVTTSAPVYTAEPKPVETENVQDAPQNTEASTYTFDSRRYMLPDDEPSTQSDEQIAMAYEETEMQSDWAAVSTTLTISPKDEERVRELIDIYTSDQLLGDSYKIDADRMQYMLEVLKQEGIEFNDSAKQATAAADGDMMFTLVIS
jgi:cytoskeletal protein RodZ